MDQERLENIETKLAFQEKMIKELNDVIYDQQQEMDRIQRTCDQLTKQIKMMSDTLMDAMGPGIGPANDKPPHY